MLRFCPINSEKINENVARANALLVAALLVALILIPARWLVALLVVDFFLRGFGPRKYSPLAQISRQLVAALSLKPQITNLAPKQFAARIGFLLSALAGVFFLAGLTTAGLVVSGVILVFALLEGVAGICVACLIYPYALRLQGD